MPAVVTPGQGEPVHNPLRDRKIALDTAWGAFAPSSFAVTVPHVVFRLRVHASPAASVLAGAVFHDFGVAGALTVGAGQGLAAFVAADAEGVADAAGEAAVGLELVRRRRAAPIAMPRTTITVRHHAHARGGRPVELAGAG